MFVTCQLFTFDIPVQLPQDSVYVSVRNSGTIILSRTLHMTDVSDTGRTILARDRSPFKNISATMVSFHCCGIIPDFRQSWKIKDRGYETEIDNSFRM